MGKIDLVATSWGTSLAGEAGEERRVELCPALLKGSSLATWPSLVHRCFRYIPNLSELTHFATFKADHLSPSSPVLQFWVWGGRPVALRPINWYLFFLQSLIFHLFLCWGWGRGKVLTVLLYTKCNMHGNNGSFYFCLVSLCVACFLVLVSVAERGRDTSRQTVCCRICCAQQHVAWLVH